MYLGEHGVPWRRQARSKLAMPTSTQADTVPDMVTLVAFQRLEVRSTEYIQSSDLA